MSKYWGFVMLAVAGTQALAAEKPKKTSPYEQCQKSGRSEKDCRQYLDPTLKKSLDDQEAAIKKLKKP